MPLQIHVVDTTGISDSETVNTFLTAAGHCCHPSWFQHDVGVLRNLEDCLTCAPMTFEFLLAPDMTLQDVYDEWTGAVPLGPGLEEVSLKKLEENKRRNPYKDPKNERLKTAVARRRHIAKYIEDCIQEFRCEQCSFHFMPSCTSPCSAAMLLPIFENLCTPQKHFSIHLFSLGG